MHKNKKSLSIPKNMASYYSTIIELTDAFSKEHLNEEYAQLAKEATAALCRKKPSPITSGSAKVWACAIIHALGTVNFLYDKSQKPYITNKELISYFGVGQSTASGRSREIQQLLKMSQLDYRWMLPSSMEDSSFIWFISIDGFMVDVRDMPYEIQELAFEKGLIPYIPTAKLTIDEKAPV